MAEKKTSDIPRWLIDEIRRVKKDNPNKRPSEAFTFNNDGRHLINSWLLDASPDTIRAAAHEVYKSINDPYYVYIDGMLKTPNSRIEHPETSDIPQWLIDEIRSVKKDDPNKPNRVAYTFNIDGRRRINDWLLDASPDTIRAAAHEVYKSINDPDYKYIDGMLKMHKYWKEHPQTPEKTLNWAKTLQREHINEHRKYKKDKDMIIFTDHFIKKIQSKIKEIKLGIEKINKGKELLKLQEESEIPFEYFFDNKLLRLGMITDAFLYDDPLYDDPVQKYDYMKRYKLDSYAAREFAEKIVKQATNIAEQETNQSKTCGITNKIRNKIRNLVIDFRICSKSIKERRDAHIEELFKKYTSHRDDVFKNKVLAQIQKVKNQQGGHRNRTAYKKKSIRNKKQHTRRHTKRHH